MRWDEDVEGWLPVDIDYEIVDGVLTADIQEWSLWSWITDKLANFSQTVQEIFGRRVDAPKCSGRDLPGWVTGTTEPDEGSNAAAIRLCYEPGGGETVRMRMVNNRTFSQFVYVDPPGAWDDDVQGPAPSFSIVGVLHQAASLAFSDSNRVFMPPLTRAAVSIPRPNGPVQHTITFSRDHTFGTFLADVVFFVAAHINTPIGHGNFAYATVFVRLVFECTAARMEDETAIDLGAVEAIVGTAVSCANDLATPLTSQNLKLARALTKTAISPSQVEKNFGSGAAPRSEAGSEGARSRQSDRRPHRLGGRRNRRLRVLDPHRPRPHRRTRRLGPDLHRRRRGFQQAPQEPRPPGALQAPRESAQFPSP